MLLAVIILIREVGRQRFGELVKFCFARNSTNIIAALNNALSKHLSCISIPEKGIRLFKIFLIDI